MPPGIAQGHRIQFKSRRSRLGSVLFFGFIFRLVARPLLERSTQDVSKRSAGIGSAVLGDRLFFLGNLKRLDGNADLVRLAIKLRNARVHFLPDGETLGTLLATIARQVRALDKGCQIGADDLDVDAGFFHLGHLAGDKDPFLRSPADSIGSPASCFTPSEIRSFSTSTSRTCALTMSPLLYSSITCSPGRFQSRSDRWTMPSTSPSSPRNSPNSVLFLTSPSTVEPGGCFSTNTSHGFRMVCFRPREIRRFTGSTSRTCTSTSCEVETILPG